MWSTFNAMDAPELELLTPENIVTHPRAAKLRQQIENAVCVLCVQKDLEKNPWFHVENLYTEEIQAVEEFILHRIREKRVDVAATMRPFVLIMNSKTAFGTSRHTELPVLKIDPSLSPKLPTLQSKEVLGAKKSVMRSPNPQPSPHASPPQTPS